MSPVRTRLPAPTNVDGPFDATGASPWRIEIVQVDLEIQEGAWRVFEKYSDKSLSFTDSTSFAVMRHGQIGLAFTLDHRFRQFGFDVVPASTAAKR